MLKAYFERMRARRAYQRAVKACLRAAEDDRTPYGLWEALDDVRRDLADRLIDAEVNYLEVMA